MTKPGETKRRRTGATTDSTNAEEEVATAPSSDQSLDLPEGVDSCSSTSAQSLQFANLSSVENAISPSSASATCNQVTDFSSSTPVFTTPTTSRQGSSSCTPKNSKGCIHKAKCDNLQKKNRRLKGKVSELKKNIKELRSVSFALIRGALDTTINSC